MTDPLSQKKLTPSLDSDLCVVFDILKHREIINVLRNGQCLNYITGKGKRFEFNAHNGTLIPIE